MDWCIILLKQIITIFFFKAFQKRDYMIAKYFFYISLIINSTIDSYQRTLLRILNDERFQMMHHHTHDKTYCGSMKTFLHVTKSLLYSLCECKTTGENFQAFLTCETFENFNYISI